MATRKKYAEATTYERKLEILEERMDLSDVNYNFDRHGAWIEFRYKGELYRFDHTVESAREHGQDIYYGTDVFAQIVLAIEDLARITSRGIYDLKTWVAGLKYLPAPEAILPCFKVLGFKATPNDRGEVNARWKNLAKKYHPDTGGDPEHFQVLKKAAELALHFFDR